MPFEFYLHNFCGSILIFFFIGIAVSGVKLSRHTRGHMTSFMLMVFSVCTRTSEYYSSIMHYSQVFNFFGSLKFIVPLTDGMGLVFLL